METMPASWQHSSPGDLAMEVMNKNNARMLERGRLSKEKVEVMERRRMEALLRSHIAAKDRIRDLQVNLTCFCVHVIFLVRERV